MDQVVVVGDTAVSTGSYLLRIQVMADLQVRFGRFAGGAALFVPRGEYVYVGSAMRGLAARLLRHASRSQGAHHAIFVEMQRQFVALGLLRANWRLAPKRLHWHVDYLLEETAVTLTHVLLIRSRDRLESHLARRLMADAATHALIPSLGASDASGETHLLRVAADEAWWDRVAQIWRET
ncbi:MAG: GIY-YIG nuclease family protein [Ardenticatenaceae bacterium]|nr:GIY-YIG nuclease family protein [Anaerolineales bacterium]MCB8923471.1 GIY-YIG nuclease family protein [Ardenticatenaceae bacterium]MCB8991374.1 GIY-YIG nuclease family protein [Ardenticatenaceae bacterium]MCB9003804.1 GIY-YIG nuclease family protein [Ardenticatenaceae bacterium]